MREIKFRAWDKRQKQMSYPFTLVELTQYEHIFEGKFPRFLAKFNDLIWLEYTGLHDKNGKEIYEGDILQYKRDKGYYLIRWAGVEDDECGFVCDRKKPDYNYMLSPVWGEMKVIGNIHENPELLEKS